MTWDLKAADGKERGAFSGLKLTPTPRVGDMIVIRDDAMTPTYWMVVRVERELRAERGLNTHYLDTVYVEREADQ